MGLSYPALSERTQPVFDRIMEMGHIPHDIFAFYMSRWEGDKSRFFIGGYDEKYITGPIVYHKVVRKTWWTLPLDRVLLNGKDYGFCNDTRKCEVIMDTGSSLMATDPRKLNEFLSKPKKSKFQLFLRFFRNFVLTPASPRQT